MVTKIFNISQNVPNLNFQAKNIILRILVRRKIGVFKKAKIVKKYNNFFEDLNQKKVKTRVKGSKTAQIALGKRQHVGPLAEKKTRHVTMFFSCIKKIFCSKKNPAYSTIDTD